VLRNSANTYLRFSDALYLYNENIDLFSHLALQSNGNIGVGYNSTTAKLGIKGAGNTSLTDAFTVKNSSSYSLLHVEDGGNIGFGTSTPQTLFHLNSPNPYGNIFRFGSTGNAWDIEKGQAGYASQTLRFLYNGVPYLRLFSGNANFFNTTISTAANTIYVDPNTNHNVGFGTASPNPNTRTHIYGKGSSNSNNTYSLIASSNNGINNLAVRDDGDIGIGLIDPIDRLHVVGNAIRGQNTLIDNNNKSFRFNIGRYSNALTTPFSAFMGTTTSTQNYAFFGGGTSLGHAATQIRFYTAPNNTTTTGTSRLVINQNGLVGIGISTPTSRLHVKEGKATFHNNTSGDQIEIINNGVGSSSNPSLIGSKYRGYGNSLRAAIYATDEAANFVRGGLIFQTQDSNGGLSTKARLWHDGNYIPRTIYYYIDRN